MNIHVRSKFESAKVQGNRFNIDLQDLTRTYIHTRQVKWKLANSLLTLCFWLSSGISSGSAITEKVLARLSKKSPNTVRLHKTIKEFLWVPWLLVLVAASGEDYQIIALSPKINIYVCANLKVQGDHSIYFARLYPNVQTRQVKSKLAKGLSTDALLHQATPMLGIAINVTTSSYLNRGFKKGL